MRPSRKAIAIAALVASLLAGGAATAAHAADSTEAFFGTGPVCCTS